MGRNNYLPTVRTNDKADQERKKKYQRTSTVVNSILQGVLSNISAHQTLVDSRFDFYFLGLKFYWSNPINKASCRKQLALLRQTIFITKEFAVFLLFCLQTIFTMFARSQRAITATLIKYHLKLLQTFSNYK
jgi:hypothetical protein